jgi:hypothetical protein
MSVRSRWNRIIGARQSRWACRKKIDGVYTVATGVHEHYIDFSGEFNGERKYCFRNSNDYNNLVKITLLNMKKIILIIIFLMFSSEAFAWVCVPPPWTSRWYLLQEKASWQFYYSSNGLVSQFINGPVLKSNSLNTISYPKWYEYCLFAEDWLVIDWKMISSKWLLNISTKDISIVLINLLFICFLILSPILSCYYLFKGAKQLLYKITRYIGLTLSIIISALTLLYYYITARY